MKKVWSVEEQEFNDPASGFRFEFIAKPVDVWEPANETVVVLKVWNQARDRVVTIEFDHGGQRVASNVEGVPMPPTDDAEHHFAHPMTPAEIAEAEVFDELARRQVESRAAGQGVAGALER